MKIFFTDLDGTLLDHDTYSFQGAEGALAALQKKKIPLVICTSKTRAEIEFYRADLENDHPFISENGGAIFIPQSYFGFDFEFSKEMLDYYVIELGTSYRILRRALEEIRSQGLVLKGFGDMTAEEVARDTGLSLELAELAKIREYDEAFRLIKGERQKLISLIEAKSLNCTEGGRYYHIMGDSDKGKSVRILKDLFKKKFGEIVTVGLGDSENDFKMLDEVDRPYLVMKKDHSYASGKYRKAGGIGPRGWDLVVREEIKK
jgi:mannosyl-3-phosphoglycerate phosphatase